MATEVREPYEVLSIGEGQGRRTSYDLLFQHVYSGRVVENALVEVDFEPGEISIKVRRLEDDPTIKVEVV